MHKGPQWLSSQSGSHQCPGGQILHPWCLWYDRCKLLQFFCSFCSCLFCYNFIIALCFISCDQCCDLGYHASLARTMRTYLSAEYSLETSRHEGLDLIEGAVDAMDIRGDKLKFMDTHSQIFCPPARFDYQPHMGDEVSYCARMALEKGLVCL